MQDSLNPSKALVFRITHLANVRWILQNGLHCPRSNKLDPKFVSIGNTDLIDKRSRRIVPTPPGGTLHDYVPFYFTPFSPMMLNIKTGYGGVTKRANSDVVIFVSSLSRFKDEGVEFVFSDRHAYLQAAQFSSSLGDLGRIAWDLLQTRDFSRDPNRPDKMERYMAEALAFEHVPTTALLGVACYDAQAESEIRQHASSLAPQLNVVVRPKWYF